MAVDPPAARSYACRACGWSPANTATWCDLGCGRDYNTMFELPDSVVRVLTSGAQDRARIEGIKAVVDEQAEDEGLWGLHPSGKQPIVEAYLQQELRRLHALIEEV